MRVGPKIVIGSAMAAVAGFMALAEWKSRAEALAQENSDLRGRNRGLESERNSLKASNDALITNNRALHDENSKLRANQKEDKDNG